MANYLDTWKTLFPKVIGTETRPTDGIDNSLDFNTDGFPQRIASDPVMYTLENAFGHQLFSNDQRLKELITTLSNTIWDKIYPVGSYYWRNDNTNPATLFGGTWKQVKDKFVLAAGDTYAVGATGGEATHTLATSEMPSHNHSGTTANSGEHQHHVNVNVCLENDSYNGRYEGGNWGHSEQYTTAAAGQHNHSFTTESVGGGEAHNNMPPYIVAYCWMRTA